jgi:hypothetical protein
MGHIRSAPYHPLTQGNIERCHQTLKNRILLEHYNLLGDLERQVAASWRTTTMCDPTKVWPILPRQKLTLDGRDRECGLYTILSAQAGNLVPWLERLLSAHKRPPAPRTRTAAVRYQWTFGPGTKR